MKNLLIVAAAVAVIFSSCGTGGGRIKTDTDSMSYAYGVNIGYNLKMQDSMSHAGLKDKMNPNLVAKGLLDAFNGKSKMSMDSSVTVLNNYFMTSVPKKKEALEISYLESVEKAGKQKAESGLIYEIIEAGDVALMPTDTDEVVVNYVGRFREGAEFDANKEGAEFESQDSITMNMARMIPGWKEGVKLLGKGENPHVDPLIAGLRPHGQLYVRRPHRSLRDVGIRSGPAGYQTRGSRRRGCCKLIFVNHNARRGKLTPPCVVYNTLRTIMKYAIITTDKGTMKAELYADETPGTVANFEKLARMGFYDGLNFHRVIPDFVIQGGCPNGTGAGGPGWTIACETDAPRQYHERGVLSMAHAGRNTGGSQFFICHNRDNTQHLDGRHTAFGKLVDGFEVLDDIRQGDKIQKIEITEE